MNRSSLLLVSFMGALVACGKDNTQSQPDAAVLPDAAIPPPAAATRTVGHRSPFGDAFQANNLMVDGDFELTGRNDQAPWIVFTTSQQTLNYETGGHCRSGVRCAVIAPGDALVGYMASPAAEDAQIRAYIKPDSGKCSDLVLFEVDLATNNTNGSAQSTTSAPAEDGWCFFTGKVPALTYEQPALYLQVAGSAKSKSIIVDQVSVLPVSLAPVHGITMPFVPPSPEVRARIETTTSWLRAHRKFGRNTERSDP
jgi:hypothetical protein